MITYHLCLVLFLIFLIVSVTSHTIFSLLCLLLVTIIIFYFIVIKKQLVHKYLMLLLVFSIIVFIKSSLITHQIINNEHVQLKVIAQYKDYFFVSNGYEKYYLAKHYYVNNVAYIITNVQLDDYISFKARTEDLKSIANFYQFDFKFYLNANNITKQIVVSGSSVKIISGHSLRNLFFNYINTFAFAPKNWTLLLLFGQQNVDNNANFTIFSKWGIAPLIVISGLHINFFFVFLKKSLFFLKQKELNNIVCFTLLLFYIYLLNWSLPALRALIFIVINAWFKQRKQAINPITTLTITTYICLCLWPLQCYFLGFQLSFGVSFLLLFIREKFKDYCFFTKLILINIVLYLFTLPLQWQINHRFSLVTIFYALAFTPIIISYDFILLLNLFVNSFFNPFCQSLLLFLNCVINWCDRFNICVATFQVETWLLQCYYVILLFFYVCWKYGQWKIITIIAINWSLIAALWSCNFIKPYYELTMLNVGNAMCMLVTSPYNKAAILVDAGTEDLQPNNPTIYNYLSAKGIHYLDAVFLTHHDLDHVSNVNFLKKYLTIANIFENTNQLPQYLLSDFGIINNLSYGLPVKYASENNKSLVLMLQIYQYKILFTGDIEKLTEDLLISNNVLTKINILQVAHHGSKTSSTLPFLQITKPDVALIPGHFQKHRQFPNQETLQNLRKINAKIYYSGQNKTVVIKIYPRHYDIITLA